MKPHQDLDVAIGPGYAAAHQGAALLDRSKRGKVVVNGADRRSYVHAMFTNDIQALVAGTGCYSAYLTPQGRMIADMRVLDLGDVLLLDLDAEVTGEVLQKLDQFVFSEDVQFGDVTATFELLSVVGPSAAGLVSAVLDDQANADQALTARSLADWPEFHNQRAAFGGEMALVVASRELGPPGFDVFVPSGQGRKLADALRAVGAADLTDEAVEVLRVEDGRPAFGRDMDRDTIPLEAGIEARAVSFTKGCYPGQEVVIRILHRGHGRIARRLARLVMDGDTVPAAGDLLRAGDKDAGRITSAVLSPRMRRPIAIAMVYRDFLAPGTKVEVLHGDGRLEAEVGEL